MVRDAVTTAPLELSELISALAGSGYVPRVTDGRPKPLRAEFIWSMPITGQIVGPADVVVQLVGRPPRRCLGLNVLVVPWEASSLAGVAHGCSLVHGARPVDAKTLKQLGELTELIGRFRSGALSDVVPSAVYIRDAVRDQLRRSLVIGLPTFLQVEDCDGEAEILRALGPSELLAAEEALEAGSQPSAVARTSASARKALASQIRQRAAQRSKRADALEQEESLARPRRRRRRHPAPGLPLAFLDLFSCTLGAVIILMVMLSTIMSSRLEDQRQLIFTTRVVVTRTGSSGGGGTGVFDLKAPPYYEHVELHLQNPEGTRFTLSRGDPTRGSEDVWTYASSLPTLGNWELLLVQKASAAATMTAAGAPRIPQRRSAVTRLIEQFGEIARSASTGDLIEESRKSLSRSGRYDPGHVELAALSERLRRIAELPRGTRNSEIEPIVAGLEQLTNYGSDGLPYLVVSLAALLEILDTPPYYEPWNAQEHRRRLRDRVVQALLALDLAWTPFPEQGPGTPEETSEDWVNELKFGIGVLRGVSPESELSNILKIGTGHPFRFSSGSERFRWNRNTNTLEHVRPERADGADSPPGSSHSTLGSGFEGSSTRPRPRAVPNETLTRALTENLVFTDPEHHGPTVQPQWPLWIPNQPDRLASLERVIKGVETTPSGDAILLLALMLETDTVRNRLIGDRSTTVRDQSLESVRKLVQDELKNYFPELAAAGSAADQNNVLERKAERYLTIYSIAWADHIITSEYHVELQDLLIHWGSDVRSRRSVPVRKARANSGDPIIRFDLFEDEIEISSEDPR
jgi:hypothetical protein